MSNIIIGLAHHLDADSAERLGLPAKDLNPGTEIVVPEDVARGLIGAGYAVVETEKPREVAKALRRHAPAEHPVGVFQAPEPTEDDGKTDAEKVDPNVAAEPSEGVSPSAPRRGKSKD